jgi:hypothetical protein
LLARFDSSDGCSWLTRLAGASSPSRPVDARALGADDAGIGAEMDQLFRSEGLHELDIGFEHCPGVLSARDRKILGSDPDDQGRPSVAFQTRMRDDHVVRQRDEL